MVKEDLWPTIMPLPLDPSERLSLLRTLFSRSIMFEILGLMDLDGMVCQTDIVNSLSRYSNRTVIYALKDLVKIGILREHVVIKQSGERRVRAKCYTLTDLGKWFYLLLVNPLCVDRDLLKSTVEGLFGDVIHKVIMYRDIVCLTGRDLSKMLCKKIMESYIRQHKSRGTTVVTLGSIAIDHYVRQRKSLRGTISYYEYLGSFPGGSGANVAVALSRLGTAACFYGKVATDMYGVELLIDLLEEGVSVDCVEIDKDSNTIETIVFLSDSGRSNILCMINDRSALSPDKLDDRVVEYISSSKAIYVGEVFYEVALKAMEIAYSSGKLIVYRPLEYALDTMMKQYLSLLKYSPIVILNRDKASLLTDRGLSIPSSLFELGASYVILTLDSDGAVVYGRSSGSVRYRPPSVKTVDTVGAGDMFSATLLHMLVNGYDLYEAVKYSVAAATYSVTSIGPRTRVLPMRELEERIGSVVVERV